MARVGLQVAGSMVPGAGGMGPILLSNAEPEISFHNRCVNKLIASLLF